MVSPPKALDIPMRERGASETNGVPRYASHAFQVGYTRAMMQAALMSV